MAFQNLATIFVSIARKRNIAVIGLVEHARFLQAGYGLVYGSLGNEYGSKVLERHTMLYEFLHDVLGVPAERADDEACL
ncbi:MAG: hypothetical protein K6F70_04275, partial [Eggerthellaceae bacterium]|nr:hypothetical protein [Eggerthellaceae bacterium]